MLRKSIWLLFLISIFLISCSDQGTKPIPPPIEGGGTVDAGPCWSHDGRYIFYYRSSRDTVEIFHRYGQLSIWVYDTQTGHHGFFLGPGEFPHWNRDGTILAFNWGQTIFFYYPDTRTVRQVTHGMIVYDFDWSYDGSELLLSFTGMVIDTLGNSIKSILSPGYLNMGNGDWSRSPNAILMPALDSTYYWSIIVVDSNSNPIQEITKSPNQNFWYDYVTWSPDESKIAANYSYEVDRQSHDDLRLFNSDGSLERVLADSAGVAAWSPDGSRIIFQKTTWMAPSPAPMIEPDIARVTPWICNADGSDMHELLGWPQVGYDSTMFDGGYNWVTNTWGP